MSRFNPEPSHMDIPLPPVTVPIWASQMPQEAVESERPQLAAFQYRGTSWFRFVENV
jgi:hypothetical protein